MVGTEVDTLGEEDDDLDICSGSEEESTAENC
jgi:hypothetical protein